MKLLAEVVETRVKVELTTLDFRITNIGHMEAQRPEYKNDTLSHCVIDAETTFAVIDKYILIAIVHTRIP